MSSLWLNDGGIVVDNGNAILCDTCPCDNPDAPFVDFCGEGILNSWSDDFSAASLWSPSNVNGWMLSSNMSIVDGVLRSSSSGGHIAEANATRRVTKPSNSFTKFGFEFTVADLGLPGSTPRQSRIKITTSSGSVGVLLRAGYFGDFDRIVYAVEGTNAAGAGVTGGLNELEFGDVCHMEGTYGSSDANYAYFDMAWKINGTTVFTSADFSLALRENSISPDPWCTATFRASANSPFDFDDISAWIRE